MAADMQTPSPGLRLSNPIPQADEAPASRSTSSAKAAKPTSISCRVRDVITYTPRRCRYHPAKPPEFSFSLNLLFAFAGTFTVANLYYNHPILNILAEDFNVTNERASLVPTMAQAGYAGGLLFLCPLGDIFRRRNFVLLLVLFTATAWYAINTRQTRDEGANEHLLIGSVSVSRRRSRSSAS